MSSAAAGGAVLRLGHSCFLSVTARRTIAQVDPFARAPLPSPPRNTELKTRTSTWNFCCNRLHRHAEVLGGLGSLALEMPGVVATRLPLPRCDRHLTSTSRRSETRALCTSTSGGSSRSSVVHTTPGPSSATARTFAKSAGPTRVPPLASFCGSAALATLSMKTRASP
jgi:hypothetical protein